VKVRIGARREWLLPNSGTKLVARVPDPDYGKERLHVTLESVLELDPDILDIDIYQYDVLTAARALTEAYEWALTEEYLSSQWSEYEEVASK
jgi:hypothetical protein